MAPKTKYELNIDDSDAMGLFLVVHTAGDEDDIHLSVFVNQPEGETIAHALEVANAELNDPVAVWELGMKKAEVERQRKALAWLLLQQIPNAK